MQLNCQTRKKELEQQTFHLQHGSRLGLDVTALWSEALKHSFNNNKKISPLSGFLNQLQKLQVVETRFQVAVTFWSQSQELVYYPMSSDCKFT